MQSFKIYLAGGMSGLSFIEQSGWRKFVKEYLNNEETRYKLDIINPVDFYNFEEKRQNTEKEPMEFDLFHVRTSQLIIVNFNKPNSIGTAMELMLAKELHIPVIGLNNNNVEIHPWLNECCTRICKSMYELLLYIYNFYLLP